MYKAKNRKKSPKRKTDQDVRRAEIALQCLKDGLTDIEFEKACQAEGIGPDERDLDAEEW